MYFISLHTGGEKAGAGPDIRRVAFENAAVEGQNRKEKKNVSNFNEAVT